MAAIRVRGFSPQAGEEMWALVRRHRFFLYAKGFLTLLVGVAPLVALGYGFARFGELGEDSQQWSLATISAIWLANWCFRFYLLRYRYHNEVWLVTDRRLVHIYRRHWFKGGSNAVELAEVAQVTVARSRLWGWLLGYGDVHCWRADGRLALALAGVARPQQLQNIIERLRERSAAKN